MFLTFWRSGGWTVKILMLAMCAKKRKKKKKVTPTLLSNKCSAHTYSGTLSSHRWHHKLCTSGVNQQKLHKHTHKNTSKNRHTQTGKHSSQYPLKKIPLNSWTSDITGVSALALDLLVHTPRPCNLSCWVTTVHTVRARTRAAHPLPRGHARQPPRRSKEKQTFRKWGPSMRDKRGWTSKKSKSPGERWKSAHARARQPPAPALPLCSSA